MAVALAFLSQSAWSCKKDEKSANTQVIQSGGLGMPMSRLRFKNLGLTVDRVQDQHQQQCDAGQYPYEPAFLLAIPDMPLHATFMNGHSE
jgi:hypothetical protein